LYFVRGRTQGRIRQDQKSEDFTRKAMTDPIGEFLDAMHRQGCAPGQREVIKPDDRIHGYTLLGDKPHKKAESYRFAIINGRGIGWFRNHREGVTHNFVSGRPGDTAAFEAEIKRRRAELDKERRQREKETARSRKSSNKLSP
jgi:hypothetical protein